MWLSKVILTVFGILIMAFAANGQSQNGSIEPTLIASSGDVFFDGNGESVIWSLGELSVDVHFDGIAVTEGFLQTYFISTSNDDLIIEQDAIEIWPNPSSSFINLRAENINVSQLRIYNSQGMAVYNEHVPILSGEQVQLSIDYLPIGIYHLQIIGDQGQVGTKKIIIN